MLYQVLLGHSHKDNLIKVLQIWVKELVKLEMECKMQLECLQEKGNQFQMLLMELLLCNNLMVLLQWVTLQQELLQWDHQDIINQVNQ